MRKKVGLPLQIVGIDHDEDGLHITAKIRDDSWMNINRHLVTPGADTGALVAVHSSDGSVHVRARCRRSDGVVELREQGFFLDAIFAERATSAGDGKGARFRTDITLAQELPCEIGVRVEDDRGWAEETFFCRPAGSPESDATFGRCGWPAAPPSGWYVATISDPELYVTDASSAVSPIDGIRTSTERHVTLRMTVLAQVGSAWTAAPHDDLSVEVACWATRRDEEPLRWDGRTRFTISPSWPEPGDADVSRIALSLSGVPDAHAIDACAVAVAVRERGSEPGNLMPMTDIGYACLRQQRPQPEKPAAPARESWLDTTPHRPLSLGGLSARPGPFVVEQGSCR